MTANFRIDVDEFDDRMKAIKPRAAFAVPNTALTGDGNLPVDLTFEAMDDFSPAAIAQKVAPLRQLLQARTELAHLATYMDGKAGAENTVAQLISDQHRLRLSQRRGNEDTGEGMAEALESAETAPSSTGTVDSETETQSALDDIRRTATETVTTTPLTRRHLRRLHCNTLPGQAAWKRV